MTLKNNLANYFTMLRIILTPILCLFLLNKFIFKFTVLLFTFIFATDWIDGFLARKNKVSNLGKILDPVADKILVFSILLCLVYFRIISIWPFVILLFRDFLMSSIRTLLAKEKVIYSANIYGKMKTTTQFFSLLFFISSMYYPTNENTHMILSRMGLVSLWISVVLSIISFCVCIFEHKNEIKNMILE